MLPRTNGGSVVYMLAIDMGRYGFGYAVGADHPNLQWSSRIKKESGSDGPDGFGARAPLATIGALPPYLVDTVEGVFAGGFKREHGAFAFGPFSKLNNNSHFGFMENGVVLSRLNPGLATAIITPDGSMDMKTWPEDGDKDLRYLVHARQNGVPVVDGIDANGVSIPGALVNKSGHFEDLGQRLEKATESYNKAMGSLESRVLVSARRFEELQAAPTDQRIEPLEPIETLPRKLEEK